MKIYVASTLSNWASVHNIYDGIAEAGWEVTYDWTTHARLLDFRNQLKNEARTPCAALTPSVPELQEISAAEVAGVRAADVLLLAEPGGRGTYFEMGCAWILGKPIIVMHNLALNERPLAFHHLPNVQRVTTWPEARALLQEHERLLTQQPPTALEG